MKKYDNTSISSLKDEERVRKRPAVIFGSDGIEGAKHAFFEILSNSIDEAREGFGNQINITRKKDYSIIIEDFGRGIPLDFNEKENRYNWELVYLELYAGGKYSNNYKGSYKFSLGLNGLGACATQYSSEFFDVIVKRDNKEYSLHFENGKNIGGLKIVDSNSKITGTKQHFKLDLEVFTDIDIEFEYFDEMLKKQAIVNKGLKFIFYDEFQEKEFIYFYENGILDYIKEINENKEISSIKYFKTSAKGKDREDKSEYDFEAEIVFCFNNENTSMQYFHNSSFLEYGGAPEKAVKSAFLSVIDSHLKKQNKYLKNEKKIVFQDIQESLVIIINSFSTETSYENQTKKAITNKFIQEYLTNYLKDELEIYFLENSDDMKIIIEQILVNKRSRENSEIMRINIKKKLNQKIDNFSKVKKFVDCKNKKPEKRELYIVEGDSALGACKLARNPEFQALIPVRGKILNCLKADLNTIFKNDIIVDLIKILGCGVEIKTKNNSIAEFDIKLLKYSKVIICTDADVDGYQIRTLILTFFYRLMPSLLKNGKIYIAESPLYEINTKNNTYFAYNESERREILKEKVKSKNYKIQRSKGLGENEPDMMWQTTMNPETRRLIQVISVDDKKEKFIFNTLLGDDIFMRKKFIEENGVKYMDMLDIS